MELARFVIDVVVFVVVIVIDESAAVVVVVVNVVVVVVVVAVLPQPISLPRSSKTEGGECYFDD